MTIEKRKLLWDEGNRLEAIDDNIYVSIYWHAAGSNSSVSQSIETDHLGNNVAVADATGAVQQVTHYYPYGKPINDTSSEQNLQPYKYSGKEQETMMGLTQYDFHARTLDYTYARFTTQDPLAEKYYNISPYAYCGNNPVRFIDPTGMLYGEYEYNNETKKWDKISDIGDAIGVDFYHYQPDEKGNQLTMVTDRQAHWAEMKEGRQWLSGGEIRGTDVNWRTIYNEFKDGTGPANSVFEGNHPANEAIQEHYLYKWSFDNYLLTGEKFQKIDWRLLDILKTGFENMWAQMMGSYTASFYKLGDRTLSFVADSKSKSSLYYHLTPEHMNYERGKEIYYTWAGTWVMPPQQITTTRQNYLFWVK